MRQDENVAVDGGGGVTRLETEAEKQRRERAPSRLVRVRRMRRDMHGDRRGVERRLRALERRLRTRRNDYR